MKQLKNVLNIAATLLLTALLAVPLSATAREDEADAPAPSFWKVEGEENTLWLFGSIHVLTEEHYPLAEAVETAFEESAYLVVETDIVNLDPQVQQRMMLNTGMLGEDQTLRDVLGEEQYERAQSLAQENGYDLEQMSALRPWLIALVLQVTEFQKLGYTAEHGVDTYFLERASEGPQSIVELESFKYQLQLFDNLDQDIQNAFLMQTLEEIQDVEEQIEALVEGWESGKLEELEETLMADFNDYPEVYDRVVTQRNRNWLESLSEFLDEGERDYFVVVGALHMVGEEGLVNLLREAGYTVERQ